MKACATIAGVSFLLLASSGALAQQAGGIPVSVVTAEKRPLADTNRFVGRVEAIERVDVRARVTGYLEKILFKDGDTVKAGAPSIRSSGRRLRPRSSKRRRRSRKRVQHSTMQTSRSSERTN